MGYPITHQIGKLNTEYSLYEEIVKNAINRMILPQIRTTGLLLITFLGFGLSGNTFAVQLDKLRATSPQHIELQGDFGQDCKQCEIIVDYGKGFKYAYRPDRWNARKLSFNIHDFGKSLKVKVMVKTAQGITKSKAFTIKPQLKPVKLRNKPASRSQVDKTTLFTQEHKDPFGGKGIDLYKIVNHPATCGSKGELFHDAKIIFGKKRFGEARIEQKPKPGCSKCTPVKVRWFHEPTGSVNYQLEIQRRIVHGVCREQVRR